MKLLTLILVFNSYILNFIYGCDFVQKCDILIAGGSTAALSAALNAARVSPESLICLTEPTSWLGGQMTSSAVSAFDFGNQNRISTNMPTDLKDLLDSLGGPGVNSGNCWVSIKCYLPTDLINNWIKTQIGKYLNLKIFYQRRQTHWKQDHPGYCYSAQRKLKCGRMEFSIVI